MKKEIKDGFMNRLRELAHALRFKSILAMQTELGFSNSYFRNLGRINNEAAVRILERHPNANIDYVNYGIGTPLKNKKESVEINRVPLIPVVALGGVLNDFETAIRDIDCELIASPISNATMAIAVNGDSMSPEFPSGSIVYISKVNESAFIEWGKTYVLDTINGIIIKNIFPAPKNDDTVICRSVNQNYNDFTIDKQFIRGWYRVRGSFTIK